MFVQRQEYIDGRSVSERSSYHHAPAFVQSHCSALHHVPHPAIKEGAHVEHEVAFVVFEHQERTQRPSLCVRPMRGGSLRVEMPSPPTAVQLTHTALDLRPEAHAGSKRSAAECHTAHSLREWCPLPARKKVM